MSTRKGSSRWPELDDLYDQAVADILAHDATFPGDPKPTRVTWSHYQRHEETNWGDITAQNENEDNPPVDKWMRTSLLLMGRAEWLGRFARAQDSKDMSWRLGDSFQWGSPSARRALVREVIACLNLTDLTTLLAYNGTGGEHIRPLAIEALATAEAPPKAKRTRKRP